MLSLQNIWCTDLIRRSSLNQTQACHEEVLIQDHPESCTESMRLVYFPSSGAGWMKVGENQSGQYQNIRTVSVSVDSKGKWMKVSIVCLLPSRRCSHTSFLFCPQQKLKHKIRNKTGRIFYEAKTHPIIFTFSLMQWVPICQKLTILTFPKPYLTYLCPTNALSSLLKEMHTLNFLHQLIWLLEI